MMDGDGKQSKTIEVQITQWSSSSSMGEWAMVDRRWAIRDGRSSSRCCYSGCCCCFDDDDVSAALRWWLERSKELKHLSTAQVATTTKHTHSAQHNTTRKKEEIFVKRKIAAQRVEQPIVRHFLVFEVELKFTWQRTRQQRSCCRQTWKGANTTLRSLRSLYPSPFPVPFPRIPSPTESEIRW